MLRREHEKARKRCFMAAREKALYRLAKNINESSSSLRIRPNRQEDIESGRLDNIMISINCQILRFDLKELKDT